MAQKEIKNLDYNAYKVTYEHHKNHQQNWVKTGYAPLHFYVKDFSIIEYNGEYHLFHIAGTPGASCVLPGNEIWFGHAVTKDFKTWQTLEPCLYIDVNSDWDNGHVFAPYVIEHADQFYMFYTGATIQNTQRIGLAVSNDLMNWARVGDKPIIEPSQYEWAFCPTQDGAACRDPHVMEIDGEFYLYYTAVTNQGKGCVALAKSTDLITWHDHGPVYVLQQPGHCESSNVQKIKDKYYLFFGGHGKSWSYVISDSPDSWPCGPLLNLGEGITAMEVIKKNKTQWLVAFFRQNMRPFHQGCRLFLGLIDWSQNNPKIQQLEAKEQLTGWFNS